MAFNDTEIEIKIPLDEKTFSKTKEKIKKIASFVKTSEQKDEYFTPTHENFLEPEFPFKWLSIREREGKSILNYKHYYPEFEELHTHCDEFELVIENAEKMKKIFSALALKSLVIVEKKREAFKNNEFEIVFDVVKDLGYFMEIEAVKDFGSIEKTRKALLDFAVSMEIDISKEDHRGYPFLLLKKKLN